MVAAVTHQQTMAEATVDAVDPLANRGSESLGRSQANTGAKEQRNLPTALGRGGCSALHATPLNAHPMQAATRLRAGLRTTQGPAVRRQGRARSGPSAQHAFEAGAVPGRSQPKVTKVMKVKPLCQHRRSIPRFTMGPCAARRPSPNRMKPRPVPIQRTACADGCSGHAPTDHGRSDRRRCRPTRQPRL